MSPWNMFKCVSLSSSENQQLADLIILNSKKIAVYGYIRSIDMNSNVGCKGSNISINRTTKRNIIRKTEGKRGYQSAFLMNRISSGVHQWSFKILSHSGGSNIDIGIWKTKQYGKPITDNYFTKKKNNGYAYVCTRGVITLDNSAGRYGLRYGKRCVANDVIDMILDMNKLELSFCVNKHSYGKAFSIENTTYRAAVDMYSQHDQLQLVSYQQNAKNSENGFRFSFLNGDLP
eukprot:307338_1